MDILTLKNATATTLTFCLGDGERYADGYEVSLYNAAKTEVVKTGITNEDGEVTFTGLTPQITYYGYYSAAGYTEGETLEDSDKVAKESQWSDLVENVKNKANKTSFTGTDGTSAGTMGLVPAPATTDAGKFLKADGSWAESGGGIKTLTTADYNYPDTGTKTAIALWKLEAGMYKILEGLSVYYEQGVYTQALIRDITVAVFSGTHSNGGKLIIGPSTANGSEIGATIYSLSNQGTLRTGYSDNILRGRDVVDHLTSTLNKLPLSANMGRILDQKIDRLIIRQSNAPTTSTVGTVGKLLEDITNGKLYQCTSIDNTDPQAIIYTWEEVGGDSGPTVVQTTGTSTTDVMSQNAVTTELNTKAMITMTTTDPGEGAATIANTFTAVYSAS